MDPRVQFAPLTIYPGNTTHRPLLQVFIKNTYYYHDYLYIGMHHRYPEWENMEGFFFFFFLREKTNKQSTWMRNISRLVALHNKA